LSIEKHAALGVFTESDFVDMVQMHYPGGISTHEEYYMHVNYGPYSDGGGNSFVPYSPAIEAIFELIRQWKYPAEPSRFQSVFGCQAESEAHGMAALLGRQEYAIYKVATESYQIRDMSMLLLGKNFVSSLLYAEKYWTRNSGPSPIWEAVMQPPIKIIERVA
jgi:hypothetical protein